jgi:ribonucleotide monophosphatase NagD (HAD superfamily)
MTSALVLSGATTLDDIDATGIHPDYVLRDVSELVPVARPGSASAPSSQPTPARG